MIPAPFAYHAPHSLEEALAVLASHPPGAVRLLAGGQSLMPALVARQATPAHLLDLNGIGGLDTIERMGGAVRIGALVRQQQALVSPLVARDVPLLAAALRHVAHRAVRHRGTVVGSICQLDPWAEVPLAAAALDAEVEVAGPHGTRRMAFAAFAQGANRPALSAQEIVTALVLPVWPAGHLMAFEEVSRRPNDPALVAVAVLMAPEANGRIGSAMIALGGILDVPLRCRRVEAALAGHPADDAAGLAGSAIAWLEDLGDALPRGDVLAESAYRRRVAEPLIRRALTSAMERKDPDA
jgi:carbon-monoxide dehydrogenase medium subunit